MLLLTATVTFVGCGEPETGAASKADPTPGGDPGEPLPEDPEAVGKMEMSGDPNKKSE